MNITPVEFYKNSIGRYQHACYREKYPELFSQEFEDFCKKEIIPLANRIYNQNLESGSSSKMKNKNIKSKVYFLIIMNSIFLLLFIVLSQACVAEALVCFTPILLFLNIFIISIWYDVARISKKLGPLVSVVSTMKNQILEIKKIVYEKLFSFYDEFKYQQFPTEYQNKKLIEYDCKMLGFRGGACFTPFSDSFIISKGNLDIYLREVELHRYYAKVNNTITEEKGGPALLYRVKLQKESSGRVIVLRKILEHLSGVSKNRKGFENVELESAEFNKYFRVIATDPQEARLFLTPAFMSRLIDFVRLEDKTEVNVSVERGFLNIVVSMDENFMFEPN